MTVRLQGAGGEKNQLAIEENGARGLVRFEDTQQPGLYVLRRPDGVVEHYVVNTERGESDLAQLEPSEVDQLAKDFDAQVVSSLDEYKGRTRDKQNAMDVWKWFLWSVLIFCFGELILQQWMSRGKA